MGVRGPSAVTVVAERPTLADALASAITVLGPEKGFPLLDRHPRAAAVHVRRNNGDVKERTSERFESLDVQR